MKDAHFLVLVAVAGILVGVGGYHLSQQGKGYCEKIEQEIRQNKTFNGAIACYPPGEVPVNVTDSIKNRTQLKCVCRQSYMGETRVFTINVAD